MEAAPSAPPKVVAFYLPQFHPIPENDRWWGEGFTEWTNVRGARKLYPSHYQPRIPGELGYYDLRSEETRAAQASLAREHGVAAFCYWHYWFAGKRLLDRPLTEVIASGEPDFPFCLGWANETWSGIWHGAPDRILIEQSYPGEDDHRRHFEALLPAFHDRRYFRINGRPVFYVYVPDALPDTDRFLDLWRALAADAGLDGMYFVGRVSGPQRATGASFDALVREDGPRRHIPRRDLWRRTARKFGIPPVRPYSKFSAGLPIAVPERTHFPCVLPGWDNTPRSGANGVVLHGATPDAFRAQVERAAAMVAHAPMEERVIFLKSWNEWAEGNYMEPDEKFGRGFLEALRDGLKIPAPSGG